MKKILFLLTLGLMTWSQSMAQESAFLQGTYGIDKTKKMIVVTGNENVTETCSVEGVTYRLYRTTLPVINVTTDGPIVNTPAVHGIISVADTSGTVIEMHAGFKIRGSSSQQFDKKSYRVELWEDATGTVMADTTFLGMRSDDDWNLEAMYNQPLRLRNKISNELWREIYQLPYQASEPEAASGVAMRYADLFVNGDYMGVYTLTERVDRKLLGLRKYNGNIRGVLYKGNGPGAPSFDSLPDYDNTLDEWDQFEWVYPNEDSATIDWSSLYSLVNFVMNATNNAFYSQYATMLEKDNLIDYYIFINALRALDNMDRNTFLARYKKSSAYFYVPWDLDAVMGNDNNGEHESSVTGLMSNGLYNRLVDDCSATGFAASLQNRYNSLRQTVLTKEHIMAMARDQYEELLAKGAYDRESEAWPEYQVNAGELDYMADWIERRLAYLDVELNEACGTWEAEESTGDLFVEVFPNPASDRVNLRFRERPSTGAMVHLYDMTGRLVLSTQSAAQALQISTAGLPDGLYSLVVHAGEIHHVARLMVVR